MEREYKRLKSVYIGICTPTYYPVILTRLHKPWSRLNKTEMIFDDLKSALHRDLVLNILVFVRSLTRPTYKQSR